MTPISVQYTGRIIKKNKFVSVKQNISLNITLITATFGKRELLLLLLSKFAFSSVFVAGYE